MFARKATTTLTLKDDFYGSETEKAITALRPAQRTERITALPDKTSQFCSMMNMIIKNSFAVVTINLDDGYGYRVIKIHKYDKHLIEVAFLDYGGKTWRIRVSEFNCFSIFRGVGQ